MPGRSACACRLGRRQRRPGSPTRSRSGCRTAHTWQLRCARDQGLDCRNTTKRTSFCRSILKEHDNTHFRPLMRRSRSTSNSDTAHDFGLILGPYCVSAPVDAGVLQLRDGCDDEDGDGDALRDAPCRRQTGVCGDPSFIPRLQGWTRPLWGQRYEQIRKIRLTFILQHVLWNNSLVIDSTFSSSRLFHENQVVFVSASMTSAIQRRQTS